MDHPIRLFTASILALFLIAGCGGTSGTGGESARPISREHPRLLGTAEHLKNLAKERLEAWARVVDAARNLEPGDETVMDDHMKMVSMALVCAIEDDEEIGKAAVQRALKYIEAPIRVGHETFAHDLARCAIVYDLCHSCWTPEQRKKFIDYFNATVDANVNSETNVFHNAWYGYKHWGYGLACYATWYENERAPEILAETERDYRERAAPALEISGNGGGFAEGYYINYWSYEWLFFCEVARLVEGKDYYSTVPGFYGKRAIASMFEAYPWMSERNSRRPIPMGDSGGQKLRRERDKALSARRILVNHFREDPAHQAVHAFNETTPVSSTPGNAYKDFLWRDTSVHVGDLENFKLSHFSPAAGYIYARSSWGDDATHFYFKCGDRFTAHQHLDNAHFLISKYDELAGDGGQYYYFGGDHDVNYLARTIAHNSILVYDPEETWPDIRAHVAQFGGEISNDGGQHHNWPHHNGAVADAQEWLAHRELYDIADMLAFEDRGTYLYVAGDCSRAYAPKKLENFTRQIVYLRPGTFVIFDRVKSTKPEYRKTWLLQAAKVPSRSGDWLVVTNDSGGRLFDQSLLPLKARIKLNSGDSFYTYHGKSFPPEQVRGPAPECRVEISPSVAAQQDYFLHVLTATEAGVNSVPLGKAVDTGSEIKLKLGDTELTFTKDKVGGRIAVGGSESPLAEGIVEQ